MSPDPGGAAGLADGALLDRDEAVPVTVHHPDGRSPFFLTCDHAGRRLPRRLGHLGLARPEFERHIAWDIGAAATAQRLSQALDATLVEQGYSRLVIDCNRPLHVPGSIPTVSEITRIPGNEGLGSAERTARIDAIFRPYHEAIAAELDARLEAGRPTVLVAMHSFTPVYKGEARPWPIGTLYGRDGRLARALRARLLATGLDPVGDNEPYSVSDETDYTIPVHGEARGLVHVGIEIRQDLITSPAGQAEWAERLAVALPRALDDLRREG